MPLVKVKNELIGSVERFANEHGLRMRIESAIDELSPRFGDSVRARVMALPVYRNDQFGLYGRCRPAYIELAGRLFLAENAAELKQTFIHEVGHSLSCKIYDAKGHGLVWRKCMVALGSWPEPVHKVLVDWKAAPVVYVCIKCGHLVSRSRRWQHRYIMTTALTGVVHPTQSAYTHKRCGKDSRFDLFAAKGVMTDAGKELRHLVTEPESCKGMV